MATIHQRHATTRASDVFVGWNRASDYATGGVQRYQYRVAQVVNGVVGTYSGARSFDVGGSSANSVGGLIRYTSLLYNTRYSIQVREVRNGVGEPWSNALQFFVLPAPVTGFSAATAGTPNTIELSWSRPVNNEITGYEYRLREYSGSSGGSWRSWTPTTHTGELPANFSVKGLRDSTQYGFQLRIVISGVKGFASAEATAKTQGLLSAVTGLKATGGAGWVFLQWTATGVVGATGFEYRAIQDNAAFRDSQWRPVPNSGISTVEYVVPQLLSSTRYKFQVRVVKGAQKGASGTTVRATTTAGARVAPADVTGLSGTAKISGVDLSWDDPSDVTILRYQVRRRAYANGRPGNWSGWATIDMSNRSTTSHTVSGLASKTTFGFQVRAVNHVGNGGDGTEEIVTTTGLPGQVQGLSASSGGDQRVPISWNALNDNSVIRFEYRQREYVNNVGQSWGNWRSIPLSSASTRSYTVVNLKHQTKYGFQIRAVNAEGNGPDSLEITATTAAEAVAPARPGNFRATGGQKSIFIQWNNPSDISITRYEYRLGTYIRRISQWVFQGWGEWVRIPGSSDTTTSYTITGLADSTQYAVVVRAVNDVGNGAQSLPGITTTGAPIPVPSAVSGLKAVGGVKKIDLTWNDPNNGTITRYWIRQRVYDSGTAGLWGNWALIPNATSDTTSHSITGLEDGTQYGFQVRAQNTSGVGPDGVEVTATTDRAPVAPDSPDNLMAIAGDTEVELRWELPDDNVADYWEYGQRRYRSGLPDSWGSWNRVGGDGTVTTITIKNLTNDVVYGFRVRGVNDVGNSPDGPEVTAIPRAPAIPLPVTGLNVEFGDKRAFLNWTNPGDDTITRWEWRRRTFSSSGADIATDAIHDTNWQIIAGSGPTTSTFIATGLTNETRWYSFNIRPVNALGNAPDGTWTPDPPGQSTRTTPPGKPTGLRAFSRDRAILITWDHPRIPQGRRRAITRYWYSYRPYSTDGTPGEYTAFVEIPGSGNDTTRFLITGLEDEVQYGAKIIAENVAGRSVESDEAVTLSGTIPDLSTIEYQLLIDLEGDNTFTSPTGELNDFFNRVIKKDFHARRGRTFTGAESDHAVAGSLDIELRNDDGGLSEDNLPSLLPNKRVSLRMRYTGGGSVPGSGSGIGIQRPHPRDEADLMLSAIEVSPGVVNVRWVRNPSLTWEYTSRSDSSPWGQWISTTDNEVTIYGNVTQVLVRNAGDITVVDWALVDRYDAPGDDPVSENAPSQPAGLAVTPGDGLATLVWAESADASISHYEIQYKAAIGDEFFSLWQDIPGSNSKTKSYILYGLDNGVEYDIRIRAVNSSGASQASRTAAVTPDGEWVAIWGGRIEEKLYRGSGGEIRTTVLRCLGALSYLSQSEIQTGLISNEFSSEAIWLVYQSSFVPQGYIGPISSNNILQYWWADGDNGLQAGRALEATEDGALNELRTGAIIYDGANTRRNRLQDDPVAEFSDNLSAGTFHISDSNVIQRSRNLKNSIRVPVRQYEASVVTAVLWKYEEVIGILPGETFTLIASHDLGGVGLWLEPELGTDYTVNSSQLGDGDDLGSDIVISHSIFAGTVNLEFSNTGSQTAYIINPQLRGKSITPSIGTLIPRENEDSIKKFGRRPVTVNNSWISDINVAESIAESLLENLLNPTDILEIEFHSNMYPEFYGSVEIDQVVSVLREGVKLIYRILHIDHRFGKKSPLTTLQLVPLLYQGGESGVIILDIGPPLDVGRLGR